MAKYAIDIKPSARKELENLSDSLVARLIPEIEGLALNPRSSGCRKLRVYKDLWRIRVGDYRVVHIVTWQMLFSMMLSPRTTQMRSPPAKCSASKSASAIPPSPFLIGIIQVLQSEVVTIAQQPKKIPSILTAGNKENFVDPGIA